MGAQDSSGHVHPSYGGCFRNGGKEPLSTWLFLCVCVCEVMAEGYPGPSNY